MTALYQVPHPRWAEIVGEGRLRDVLIREGMEERDAVILAEVLTEVFMVKAREEEANYEYLCQEVIRAAFFGGIYRMDADTLVLSIEPETYLATGDILTQNSDPETYLAAGNVLTQNEDPETYLMVVDVLI